MSRGVRVLVFLAVALGGAHAASAQPLPYGYAPGYDEPVGPYAGPAPYSGDRLAVYGGYDRPDYRRVGPGHYDGYAPPPRRYRDGYGRYDRYDGYSRYDGYDRGPRYDDGGYGDRPPRYYDDPGYGAYYPPAYPGYPDDEAEDALVPPEAEGPAEERGRGFDPRRPHLGDGTDAPAEQFYAKRPRSCGEYYYWDGRACVDARKYPPYVGPKP
jgi:hypothetical protein